MAQAFFATRISKNISKTPREGYLLCTGVPINRVGWQDYLGKEINSDLEPNKIYRVYRPESEVFAPATMASFEGKSVTEGHPDVILLSATNDGSYSKGHGQNVRRGEGADSQDAICDLIIKDSVLISKVENGLREISCGYECVYVPQEDGTFLQTNIRGNHIAVVPSGRAGDRIAIKDELPEEIRKGEPTVKLSDLKKKIFGEGFKQWAKDAKPEEVAEAMEAMKGKPTGDDDAEELKKAEEKKAADAKTAKDAELAAAGEGAHAEALQKIADALAELVKRVSALEAAEAAETHETDSLDTLESELSGASLGVDCAPAGVAVHKVGDQEFYMDPEKKTPVLIKKKAGDAEAATKVIEPGKEDSEKSAAKAGDANAAVLAGIRTVKPIIAAISDPVERKKATDSLAAVFRAQIGGATKAADADVYAKIGTAKKALDEKAQTQADKDAEYGRKIKEARHRK